VKVKPTDLPAYRRPVIVTGIPVPIRRPATLPAVFRAAARLIAVNGHHQGDYCPDMGDRVLVTPHAERPLSIVGAIRCAVSGDPHVRSGLSELAVQVLAHRLEVDGEPPFSNEPLTLECHIDAWGDAEGRRAETVVAVLEAAGDAVEVAA
jgi:hypothetical protein